MHLIKKDDKVTASAATLLQKLNIRPFSYGLKVTQVYDDGEAANDAQQTMLFLSSPPSAAAAS